MNRRSWLQGATSAAAVAALGGCVHSRNPAGPDCIVDAAATPHAGNVPTFRSVAQALEQAAHSTRELFTIAIRPGRYVEKLEISRPGIELLGTSRDSTVIAFSAASGERRPGGGDWGMPGSATLSVRAPRFRAAHLTIENTFDYPANFARPAGDPLRLTSPQAVALLAAAGSDCAHFRDVAVVGHQDTLFVDAGRSFFEQCRLVGHVDFIFGAGCALFEDCEVVSRPRNNVPEGYVLAPSTSVHDAYGLVFRECRFIPQDERVRDGQTFLGRPWHPGRDFPDGHYADPDAVGAAALLHCWLDRHIVPAAWTEMGGPARDGTRVMFQPADARFFEFENRGPGAEPHPARRQLSAQDAATFTRAAILGSWEPAPFGAQ
ncbi:MAG TPA: pectinesterase family protein [Steroidobacteraceae bacterium]|nr:pectinesterase family protein [Steroidobacteraceae bacterium]